jgi:hypothetical protein
MRFVRLWLTIEQTHQGESPILCEFLYGSITCDRPVGPDGPTGLRASARGARTKPRAFTVLRLITNSSTRIAERPSRPLRDQLGAKTSVFDVGYRSRLF